jgi:hypothetical protein
MIFLTLPSLILFHRIKATFPSLGKEFIKIIICNSPPYQGGVDLVSFQETEDEVVVFSFLSNPSKSL